MANKGAMLNPCPPFSRGGEVSADALDSEYFVGYEFKKHLLEVQQAILIYCLTRYSSPHTKTACTLRITAALPTK